MPVQTLDDLNTIKIQALAKRATRPAVDQKDSEIRPPTPKEMRVILARCGVIDPEDIHDYIAEDGYIALTKALTAMTPRQVIDEVLKSGLRERGGAGFPAGKKWEFASAQKSDVKYMICNADEGDPGAFMNRSVLENDPHSVLEGMIIAGYSFGAHQGYIYCRAEYPIAVKRMRLAIEQARELGLLGKNILGTPFDFDVELRIGAGAFVCGEETALMASIEGRRGELGCLVSSNGTNTPHRVHFRTPSFANLQTLPMISKGYYIADLVGIIAMTDIVLGDVDR